LACYLFSSKLYGRPRLDVFTKQGFRSSEKVNARKKMCISQPHWR